MSRKLKLSILDQSPVRKGGNARQAILETVELVKLADKLGYTRFWVSEHHNFASLAGSAPEVLIAHLAGETNNIRVGSGGIMLPNHSSLKMAENFRLLETMFPGRIDMGIGRAPGGDRLTSSLLNPSNNFGEQEFINQVAELQHYLQDMQIINRPRGSVLAIPVAETIPDLWLLTSSGGSAIIAAHFGMALSFAQFISPVHGPEVLKKYRQMFKPSKLLMEPKANFAIFAFCADTDEKVEELRFSAEYQLLQFEKGIFQGYPSYEEIKQTTFSELEMERIRFNRNRMVWGKPDEIRSKIEKLADEYDVDEVIIVTITHDFADRLRSYELLADVFDIAIHA